MSADSNGPREPDGDALLRIARVRISSGTLPATHSGNLFAGPGQGKLCCLCEWPVGPDDVEYEVVMKAPRILDAYVFHWLCYDAWVTACGSAP